MRDAGARSTATLWRQGSILNRRVCEVSLCTRSLQFYVRCIARPVKAAPAPGSVAAFPSRRAAATDGTSQRSQLPARS